MNFQSIPKQVEHVAWSQIDDEAILLNLNNGFYYTLNEPARKTEFFEKNSVFYRM